ncbi:REF/SRPP-like protein At1g67360 [Cannabis sativa]|uniref:REF/SRPP-like protein At1g67360 n=1 Tax=Cannabis sativa TaxID=3483 RepID=UPI0029CA14FB|nr:REF/SRPP-like protein At1g67360 [Cannabis sativa]
MATTDKTECGELKRLGFVRVAAIQALVCVSNLYDYAKQNSGPLRSAVGTVEGVVTTVVTPVYDKLKGVPDDLLVFLDKKVDEATHKFDKHAPPLAKQIVYKAHYLTLKAAEKTQKFVNDARTEGPRAAVSHAATDYKHFVMDRTVNLWVAVNRYPAIHQVAEKAAPTAAQWSEKYNHTVKDLTQKGYAVFGYLPLVPVDEITKAFKKGEAGKKVEPPKEHKSDSESSDSD